MSNICDVTYKIVGDKKQVRSIYKTLQYMDKRKTPVEKNGWGKLWLGCLIAKLGGNWQDYTCRGAILNFYFDEDNVLNIHQETAWCEQDEVRTFLKQMFPDIQIYYKEEEPLCEVFYTNDAEHTYFKERYFLDSYEEQEYFETIEQASEYVSHIVGHEVQPTYTDIYDALEQHVEGHPDEDLFYSFHEFQVSEY